MYLNENNSNHIYQSFASAAGSFDHQGYSAQEESAECMLRADNTALQIAEHAAPIHIAVLMDIEAEVVTQEETCEVTWNCRHHA